MIHRLITVYIYIYIYIYNYIINLKCACFGMHVCRVDVIGRKTNDNSFMNC